MFKVDIYTTNGSSDGTVNSYEIIDSTVSSSPAYTDALSNLTSTDFFENFLDYEVSGSGTVLTDNGTPGNTMNKANTNSDYPLALERATQMEFFGAL